MQTAKQSRESKRHERFTKKLLKREMRKHEKTARQAMEEAEFKAALKELEPRRREWEEWHRLLEPTVEISVMPAPESKPDQSLIPQQPVISQTGRRTKKKELSDDEIVALSLGQKKEIYLIREEQQKEKGAMAAQHKKEIAQINDYDKKLAIAKFHNQETAELANQHFVRLNRRYAAHGADRKKHGINIKAFREKMKAAEEAKETAEKQGAEEQEKLKVRSLFLSTMLLIKKKGQEEATEKQAKEESAIVAIKKLLTEQKQKLGEEQARRDNEITALFNKHTGELASAKSTAELTAIMERHQNERLSLAKQHKAQTNRLGVYNNYYREKLKKEVGAKLWQKATVGVHRGLYNYSEAMTSCYLHKKELLNYQASADNLARFLRNKHKATTPKTGRANDGYEPSEFLRENIVSLVKKTETREALISAIKKQVKNIGRPTDGNNGKPVLGIEETNKLLERIMDKVESTGELIWLKKFCLTKEYLAKLILVFSNSRDLAMQRKFPNQDEWDEEKLSACMDKMDELIELGISLFALWEENKRQRRPNRQKPTNKAYSSVLQAQL